MKQAAKLLRDQPQNLTIHAVNLLKRIMSVLMLAFWVSAITVCAGECAKFAQDDLCCPASGEHDSDRPASSDSNCLFSVALTKIHDEERVAWDFSLLPAIAQVLFVAEPDAAPAWRAIAPDPVQTLSHEWQFITRAALPPRAPSSLC
jgi:hypothetical protein